MLRFRETAIACLVWDSSGLIGNRGLHRLLEGDHPGEPGFVYTVAASHRIGENNALAAVLSAFSQFPGHALLVDIDERLRIFESIPEHTREEIESRYHDADKETERCVASFIREHRGQHERLLMVTRTKSRTSSNPGHMPHPENSGSREGPM